MTDLGLAVQIFFQPGEVKELRILTKDGMISGFYDDRLTLGRTAKCMGQTLEDDGVKAVYWTLNPIKRSTLKFVSNELNIRPKFATRAYNILRRAWLLIDVDPERVSGTNATDGEKLEAKKVLDTVVAFLKSKYWPDPIIVDSGNGYHALYRINIPATDSETVREVLRVLDWKFSTPGAKVDRSVHDSARICKVPGTWARKGPHSEERPHRMSAILSVPPVIKTVPTTSLIGIKRYAPAAPPATLNGDRAHISGKRLKAFFATYADELTVDSTRKKGDATHYSLAECPFNGSAHRDQKKSHKTDIIVGKYGTRFKCWSDDCDAYNFQDLLDLLEERTGTRFDLEDDQELAALWGGIEDVTVKPTLVSACHREPATLVLNAEGFYTPESVRALFGGVLCEPNAIQEAA